MRQTALLLLVSLAFSAPAVAADRTVYVSQVGDGNQATVQQTAARASTTIVQSGSHNIAGIHQDGQATAVAHVRQIGSANDADIAQNGSGGADLLRLTQTGSGNEARVSQGTEGRGINTAILSQLGQGNQASLTQQGQDNQAALSQNGADNAMTATQLGAGNRLTWTQIGDHNPDLGITQYGGQALQVTQSR